MKALIINSLYSPYIRGGAEKSTQILAEGLEKLGVEPVVVCTAPSRAVDLVNGIKVYYLPLRNIYWPFDGGEANFFSKLMWHLVDLYNPLMAKEIGAILDLEQPDLVHTNNLRGLSVAVWKTAKKRGLPVIHTLRDYYLFCPRSAMFHNGQNCLTPCWNCRLFSYPKRRLSPLVDQVVGISSFILRRHCEAGFFPNAIGKVIYNPAPIRNQTSKLPSNLTVRFGYIGRLDQSKGVEELLVEFRKLDQEKASLGLAGTGEASYVNFLRERYDASNIDFWGFVPADELYNRIDVLVLPSRWHEPLGRVVLEAYSHGIPVIATRRGGIPEIVEEGRTGFLFEPENPGELANLMEKFMKDPGFSLTMAEKCWRKAGEFSQVSTSTQYFSQYQALLKPNRL